MPHNTTYDTGLNNIYCANLERYAGNNLFLHISTSLHLILKVDDAHILNSTRFLWKSYSFLLRLSEADKFGALIYFEVNSMRRSWKSQDRDASFLRTYPWICTWKQNKLIYRSGLFVVTLAGVTETDSYSSA